MVKFRCLVAIALICLSTVVAGNSCVDKLDSYSDYDNSPDRRDIKSLRPEYYLLSYSWSPGYCQKASTFSKRAGGKNYLQCASGRAFGYILHGLWPQGHTDGSAVNPRACLGNQGKIARTQLQPFLCMTPSVWLLQHQYEYHGTCMPDANLRTPTGYFTKAQAMHQQLKLPLQQLSFTASNLNWWYSNNPQLASGSIKYWQKGKEWQICYDRQFKSVSCPATGSGEAVDKPPVELNHQCTIKGNISKRSGRKYYFLPQHRNYQSVVIDVAAGERCFDTISQAKAARWQKAPN